MNTGRNLPITESMNYVILGGNLEAVKHALFVSKHEEKVLLVTDRTYLAEEVCDTLSYEEQGEDVHPDSFKRDLENKLIHAGIKLLYSTYVLKIAKRDRRQVVYVGGKFGVFMIEYQNLLDCRNLKDCKSSSCYRAFIQKANENEKYRLLTVQTEEKEGIPETLLAAKRQLLLEYGELKEKQPEWELGRLAAYPTGNLLKQAKKGYRKKAEYDVVVVGGGTAGVMAALHSARNGAKTALIEPNFDLGGTQTVGGVSTYWFGKRWKEVAEIDAKIDEYHQKYQIPRRKGIWSEQDDSHPGIRGLVYLESCLKAGVKIFFGQIAYGMDLEREDETLQGVETCGIYGERTFYGKVMLDATGDADLAEFMGAATCYGSKRDCFTYWASLAQYTSANTYKNNFSSMVYCGDAFDNTRFILLGRKRGEGLFDHGSYVSMRESRHILTKEMVDLKDFISFRTFKDGLYTGFSNYDPKGKLHADMVYAGVLPPQASFQIPLHALLPLDAEGESISGLYVLGKAIGVTHNVFPLVRMQPDLMHQGAIMGYLAAIAIQRNTTIEELDAEERQELVRQYTGDDLKLPSCTMSLSQAVEALGEDTRTHWIDVEFTYEEKEQNPLFPIFAANSTEVVPLLKKRMEKEEKKEIRDLLNRCLLWHGCEDYLDEWIEEIWQELRECEKQGGILPDRKGSIMCARLLPDHGVMTETTYRLNLLAWKTHPQIIPLFTEILQRLKKSRDYLRIETGTYHYVESFAYVAERSGNKEFAPLLEELLSFEEFEALEKETDSTDLMTERLEILKLILYRALARLGEKAGYEGIHSYFTHPNRSLQESAFMEFYALTQNELLIGTAQPIADKEW